MSDLSRDVAYWKAAHLELAERWEKADAEVTRLMARWEALKAWTDTIERRSGAGFDHGMCQRADELDAKIKELEAQQRRSDEREGYERPIS